jgi:serine protease AprX
MASAPGAKPPASDASSVLCSLCGGPSTQAELAEYQWLPRKDLDRLARDHPGWRRADGACPACVQQSLLETLLEEGEEALHNGVQKAWPLDAGAAFGALPTPLRLHAHPRYTGAGVTVALVDAAFYPHPDLVRPRNRIRAWVDASREPVRVLRFGTEEQPEWQGSAAGDPGQWHGLMTSAVLAGNGALSHGLYRGLAPDAELVLIQVRDASGRIGNAAIARALDWLRFEGPGLGVRVVNLSLGGDAVPLPAGNPVDEAVSALVLRGITVVVAAGNDGERRLVPPGTAPDALTIGGLDDRNTLDHARRALWRSNYGAAAGGAPKPELVAPSLWVVAPILPGTEVESEAGALFARRAAGDPTAEPRLSELKLVTPFYQHVEGTSFAAPVVAGVVACMLEANPALSPPRVRTLLIAAAQSVPGAPVERQGAGAIDAGKAVALALRDRHSTEADFTRSPELTASTVEFLLHDHRSRQVQVVGSWDGWARPGLLSLEVEPGLWRGSLPRPGKGQHQYKFVLDGEVWLADPANPRRAHDGHGAWNSLFVS